MIILEMIYAVIGTWIILTIYFGMLSFIIWDNLFKDVKIMLRSYLAIGFLVSFLLALMKYVVIFEMS